MMKQYSTCGNGSPPRWLKNWCLVSAYELARHLPLGGLARRGDGALDVETVAVRTFDHIMRRIDTSSSGEKNIQEVFDDPDGWLHCIFAVQKEGDTVISWEVSLYAEEDVADLPSGFYMLTGHWWLPVVQ